MKSIVKSGLFFVIALSCMTSYARDYILCPGVSVHGYVEHIESAPNDDTTHYSIGIYVPEYDQYYKADSRPGYGLDTPVGQASFKLLQEAAHEDEKVTVWCTKDGKFGNVWIHYIQD